MQDNLADWTKWRGGRQLNILRFLLYTGYLGLESVLSPKSYFHFLFLSITFRILLEDNRNIRGKCLIYARYLLRYFASKCRDIYCSTFTVYNVHNLIHVWQDVDNLNVSLDEISNLPFENYLQVLKSLRRNHGTPYLKLLRGLAKELGR